MDVPGVALRDQHVDFFVTGAQAAAANESQRTRLARILRELNDAQWAAPSRCAKWTVQELVRHLIQMGELSQQAVRAGQAGERLNVFTDFDPRTTPHELVQAGGAEPPADTLAAFESCTRAIVELVNGLDPHDTFLSVTPAGRQPWPRSTLHALFDSAVHERDITVPLGIEAAVSHEEMTAIAAYQVLLTARVACLLGMNAAFELQLDGADPLHVAVDGPSVRVSNEVGSGAPVARGPAVGVLDAMTGRGELTDVLDGPPEAAAVLSTMRGLV